MSRQVTARLAYGGITLCFAIGAVVLGWVVTFQIPLSGHLSPVRAVVPIGFLTVEGIGLALLVLLRAEIFRPPRHAGT